MQVSAYEEVAELKVNPENPVIYPEEEPKVTETFIEDISSEKEEKGAGDGRYYLRLEAVINDDKMMAYYSGFCSYSHFLFLCHFLCPEVYHLDYKCKSLPVENQLFLTLVKLRKAKDNIEIGFLFGIGRNTAAKIFDTFVRFLYFMFKDLDLWCPRAVVNLHMPAGFKEAFPDTRTILDATECRIEKPSNVSDQCFTYSTYKNGNTVKTIIGINPMAQSTTSVRLMVVRHLTG